MTRMEPSTHITGLPRVAAALALGTICADLAAGQGAMAREAKTQPAQLEVDGNGRTPAQDSLARTSLLYVEAPKPRAYKIHDQITIIIDENSQQQSKQTLDTKKDTSLTAALTKFPNLAKLIEAELATGASSPIVEAAANSKNDFKGEGSYQRTDSFRARITAKVIDVKPNGVLVLEARKVVQKDDELQTIVLSGSCRSEDVTTANSVLSSQLADLTVLSRNEGDVRDAAEKGVLTRVLDAIFNF